MYVVRDAAGEETTHPRAKLRHRVKHTEAYTGVSGDTRHDSYAMRAFVETMLGDLKSRGVLASEKLTVLANHSDNASQHFKSTKSLNWLTNLSSEYGFTAKYWDFGAPGHGKGQPTALLTEWCVVNDARCNLRERLVLSTPLAHSAPLLLWGGCV